MTPNKIIAADAGGPLHSAIRTPCPARIAEFCLGITTRMATNSPSQNTEVR